MVDDYLLRPMQSGDLPAVEQLTAEAFFELDRRTHRAGQPEPSRRPADKSAAWQRRLALMLGTDPGGCFIADDGSGVIGAAVSLRRDTTWLLSTYAVRPGLQGRGVGRHLLEAALAYGAGCLYGLVASSDDPGALRRYRFAGLSLHPMMSLTGAVPRETLPVVERVREGSAGDIDLMNSVDRQTRGAAHGPDHELLTTMYRLVVADRPTGQGYVYVESGGGPYLLAATNRRTATDLLWEALAASIPDEPCEIGNVTPANEWALDVGFEARMTLRTDGYLALRGMKPPTPYLPSPHFL